MGSDGRDRRQRREEHETRDADVRGVTLFGLALAAVIVVVLVGMVWLFDYLAAREAARQPRPSTLTSRPAGQRPPEPRLQDSPAKDLARVRAEEDRLLVSYGWVDRKEGVVRIPVDRAMEIVVQKGLR